MKKLLLVIGGSLILGSQVFAQQIKINQRDAQNRKQGAWMEEVGEVRGEPGYTWEGAYKNDRKEGIWRKTSLAGNLIAEETFHNNVLDGRCRYFFPDGKLMEEGVYMATEIEGQRDTIMVIDPVTNEETPTEIIRKGNSVRNGILRIFDEEAGKLVKQYYKRGEIVTPEELGDTTAPVESPVKKAPMQLPHESLGKSKKKC